jgi:hypothetical protein
MMFPNRGLSIRFTSIIGLQAAAYGHVMPPAKMSPRRPFIKHYVVCPGLCSGTDAT